MSERELTQLQSEAQNFVERPTHSVYYAFAERQIKRSELAIEQQPESEGEDIAEYTSDSGEESEMECDEEEKRDLDDMSDVADLIEEDEERAKAFHN